MGSAQVMQSQQCSQWCLGWFKGPWSRQGLETQQPYWWHRVALAMGGLVEEKGNHCPQQRATHLQCQ